LEKQRIFGIKKSIFYFLLFLLVAIGLAYLKFKSTSNILNIDGEDYEEDEVLQTVEINSEPIEKGEILWLNIYRC